jgi:type IV pilus assembly protein PilB
MRLLDPAATKVDFTELGFSEENAKIFRQVLTQPQGMVLVTGPTGSGKSTTLYSALNMVIQPSLNIITVEDPVEYKVREINQVQINPKAGLTFAGSLRAILRQDPNVIMVGEIRDAETAEIALQAAQTGHLVLSSLHTNDSVSAVTRLMDLKVQGFLIASSVSVVLAQRLVRKLCFCRTEAPIRAEYATRMAAAGIADVGDKMYVPTGCSACDNTGYKGRVALYEMLVLNEALRSAIRTNVQDKEICALARNQGMRLLHEDGMTKVRMGLTTIEEIARVVGFAEETSLRCASCSKVLPADFRFCSGCGTSVPAANERQQLSLTSHGGMVQNNLSYIT